MTRRVLLFAPVAIASAQDESITVQYRRTPNNGLAVIVDGPAQFTAFRVELATVGRGRVPFPGPLLTATIGRRGGETAIASLVVPDGYLAAELRVVGLVDDLALPTEVL